MAANIFAGAAIVCEPPFFRRIARPGGRPLLLRAGSLTQVAAGDLPTQGLIRGLNGKTELARRAEIGCLARTTHRIGNKNHRAMLPSFMDSVDINGEG
jgi:hypothetical protein